MLIRQFKLGFVSPCWSSIIDPNGHLEGFFPLFWDRPTSQSSRPDSVHREKWPWPAGILRCLTLVMSCHVHVALMTFQIHGIHSSYWGIFDVSYVSLCNLPDIHLRGKYTYTTWPASGNSLCFGKCSSQNQSKLYIYIKTRIRIGGPERVWNTQRINPTSLYHPIPLWRFDGNMNAQRSTNSGNNRGNWPWDHGNLGDFRAVVI